MNTSYKIKLLMSNNLTRIIELQDDFKVDIDRLQLRICFYDYEDIIEEIKLNNVDLNSLHGDLQGDNKYLKNIMQKLIKLVDFEYKHYYN